MSRHKAHAFHCNHCASPCTIYKKGRGHRVLVCPNCGVIATNPTLAGSIFKGVVGAVPIVGGVASGVIGGIQEHKAQKSSAKRSAQPIEVHHGKTSFEKALMLELMERG